MNWNMNKTEVKVLLLLNEGNMTVGELANHLPKSMSWTSNCLAHLESLGFVERNKKGNKVFASLSQNPVGQSLATLMAEMAILNLESTLANSGLTLLPLLLKPGSSSQSLVKEAGVSLRTVKSHLSRWRRMGIVVLEGGIYFLNPRYKLLTVFISRFSEFKNAKILRDAYPQARMVWQWRNEFIFSTDEKVDGAKYRTAGVSRLDDFRYDLLHTNKYYMTGLEPISEEEALVQSLLIDPNNPRMKRMIRNNAKINMESLLVHSAKYGMKTKINEALRHDIRKKTLSEG